MCKTRVRGWMMLAVCLCCQGQAWGTVEIHLSPAGNDAWSGRLDRPNAARSDGPVASLAGARDALRRYRSQHGRAEPVRVVAQGGTYFMERPLVLEPRDGGAPDAVVSYEAAAGQHPVFSGGRVIKGWSKGEGGVWHAQLEAVAAGQWYFEQLWVNGKRATRAREPNTGVAGLLAVEEDDIEWKGSRVRTARQMAAVSPEALSLLAKVPPGELGDVNFIVYHRWHESRRFVEAVDRAKGTLSVIGAKIPPHNPWVREDYRSRWRMDNARAFLDAPGEWFLARDGTLSYLPRPGEDMASAMVVAPLAQHFVEFAGAPEQGKPVEFVRLAGLSFQHSQWLTPARGIGPRQAAADIDAVVMLNGAHKVLLEDCEIAHTGRHGIWLRHGSRQVVLRRCHFHDLGAGGVRIGEMEEPDDEALLTSHIVVEDCIIRGGGRVFSTGPGVWVSFCPDIRISHNDIGDFFYTGVSVGWEYGYDPTSSARVTVEFNHIHQIGQGLLSDMGGVYTLGVSPGSVVRNNVITEVEAHRYGGWGLYTDEGSSQFLFENNLVWRTSDGSIHQHFGRDNVFRNNIFAAADKRQLEVTRPEQHNSFTLERNIVWWEGAAPLMGGSWVKLSTDPWLKLQYESRDNLYWRADGAVNFAGMTLAEWQQAGHEQRSVVADPLFVNPQRGDFRLPRDSPALRLGFRPFDPDAAGVRGTAAWRTLARER